MMPKTRDAGKTWAVSARRFGLCTAGLLVAVTAIAAPVRSQTPTDTRDRHVVVKAARVITATGDEYTPGTVVITNGKIVAVGRRVDYPPSARIIDAGDQTVTPGLVIAQSRQGLPNYTRNGVNGERTAASDVIISQLDFEEYLRAGITTVAFVPAGTGIPGMAAAYRTAGPDSERRISNRTYLHVVPNFAARGKAELRTALRKAKSEIEKVANAKKAWEDKQKADQQNQQQADEKKEETPPTRQRGRGNRTAGRGRAQQGGQPPRNGRQNQAASDASGVFKPPPIDPKHKPLVDLIEKKEGAIMMIRITGGSDLLHLDQVLKPYDDLNYSIHVTGGAQVDLNYVIDTLGERKARVLISPQLYTLPQTANRYNLFAELAEAGCEVSVMPPGGRGGGRRGGRRGRGRRGGAAPVATPRIDFRRIRWQLTDVVRAGLDRTVAIQSMTRNPARAIGLGDRFGTLEKGKDADLTFFDGDPLNPLSEVTQVMILGEMVYKAEKQ